MNKQEIFCDECFKWWKVEELDAGLNIVINAKASQLAQISTIQKSRDNTRSESKVLTDVSTG